MAYEEIGTEAFPGLSQKGLCRTLIALRIGAEVADLNYGRHRRWASTKRLLNAGNERHKCLAMTLGDARLRRSETKLLYRDHPSPPWHTDYTVVV